MMCVGSNSAPYDVSLKAAFIGAQQMFDLTCKCKFVLYAGDVITTKMAAGGNNEFGLLGWLGPLGLHSMCLLCTYGPFGFY